MKILITSLLVLISFTVVAQKKVLDHKDFEIWNTIKNKTISSDGKYVMYSLEKGEKDQFLKIKDSKAALVFSYERAEKGSFANDASFSFFTF